MTKRSLYACVVFIACFLCAGPLVHARQTAVQPPCAACLAITILPGGTLLLPDTLHGLTVLVRVSQDKTPGLATEIEHIRARGGRPGVLVPPPPTADAAAAFALKVRLTDLRGRLPRDATIALEVPDAAAAGLASYADVIVTREPGRFAGRPMRVWQLIEATTARAALAATTAGGVQQWVVNAPADVLDARTLIAELARAAAPPPDALTEAVEVTGASRLTAVEVVARHQAAARRQDARVQQVISHGVMTLTFEAPGFPAPITITSDTVLYRGGERTELEQRSIRVNGIEFRGGGVPRLPIIEPERVATPPLAIALNDLYRYRLADDDTLRGIRCYVVAFEPVTSRATLFRGRAWIAMDSFAVVRITATQTGLRGAIVSAEQIDDFEPAAADTWLLSRSEVRQLYEGAAHRTPIQRVLEISRHEVNPAGFDARLRQAYESSSLMLRDTAEGYRYLKRGPPAATSGGEVPAPVVDVAERSDRVRTLAAGVIIDPNISTPLPFAGVSYVDFNLFDTGAQLNAFFGGSYGQLAFSVPSLGGTRWQVAGRAFGIASSYNDRSFRQGREIYEENIRQRPAHASAWLLRPLTTRVSMRAGYELDYTRLTRAPETAAAFVVPADQVVHGLRLALEGQQRGWAGSIWWNPARRSGWREWGFVPGTSDVTNDARGDSTFQRYGAQVSRTMALTPTVVTRVELAAMSGRDLDRFSRYAFGTFDNRLRGYPSALVRYDRGAVIRGAAAWSASRFLRFDAFLDTASVRDRGFGSGYRNYTGVGAAVEAPAPFGILASVEWGYGFRGVTADGGTGTHVIRVSAFKVF